MVLAVLNINNYLLIHDMQAEVGGQPILNKEAIEGIGSGDPLKALKWA